MEPVAARDPAAHRARRCRRGRHGRPAQGSRLIELGVFVAIGGLLTGGLMTWGLSQAWDADAQRVALGELGYTELEITAGDDRAGAQPVLDFVGVVDGQHGERGKLRHVAGDQWEVVEF